ncbi:MAG: hypothetical protein OXU69_03165 [Gemmatimonadota bacterium]|nr:hypothetical protein [Gemmatimonadota bacterium]MDE2983683.1 hypothetical protein [Gemmatimonadota bacterium]
MRPDFLREKRTTQSRAPVSTLLAAAFLAGAACSQGGSDPGNADAATVAGSGGGETAGSESASGTVYRRSIVFIDVTNETTMFVPWDFENRIENDTVRHVLQGWLGRGGEWARFADEQWGTPLTRTPWRILPRGATRMVMGLNDVLREIYYREGIADLSVRPGEVIAEWSGQRGDTYRLLHGFSRLSEVEYPGLVVDVYAPGTDGSDQPSEWMLLIGDGPLYLFLSDLDGRGTARAWGLDDSEEMSWPTVTLTWGETRSFERARRDIPLLWRFRSGDGELMGEVEPVSSHLQAIPGEDPIRPVLGVHEVAGQISVGGTRVAVKGFLRHSQR